MDTPPLNWSDLGVSELPTGMVTLLLAEMEGSTRQWETEPEEMSAAITLPDATLCDLVAAHRCCEARRAGRGRQRRRRVRRGIVCGGLFAGAAAGSAGPDPLRLIYCANC